MRKTEKPVDPRFVLRRGETWFRGARVRKQRQFASRAEQRRYNALRGTR